MAIVWTYYDLTAPVYSETSGDINAVACDDSGTLVFGFGSGDVYTVSGYTSFNHESAPPFDSNFWVVLGAIWANGVFLIGGDIETSGDTPYIGYSSNGSSWSSVLVSGLTDIIYGFAYGEPGGVPTFMTTTANDHIAVSQDNGSSWSVHSPVSGNPAKTGVFVAYGNDIWIQAGHDGTNIIYISSDVGSSWTPVSLPQPYQTGLAFGNGIFMIVSNSGNVMTSADGSTWSDLGVKVTDYGNYDGSLAFLNGTWVFSNGDYTLPFFESTDDGVTWTQGNYTGDGTTYGITAAGDVFLAFGYDGFVVGVLSDCTETTYDSFFPVSETTGDTVFLGQPDQPWNNITNIEDAPDAAYASVTGMNTSIYGSGIGIISETLRVKFDLSSLPAAEEIGEIQLKFTHHESAVRSGTGHTWRISARLIEDDTVTGFFDSGIVGFGYDLDPDPELGPLSYNTRSSLTDIVTTFSFNLGNTGTDWYFFNNTDYLKDPNFAFEFAILMMHVSPASSFAIDTYFDSVELVVILRDCVPTSGGGDDTPPGPYKFLRVYEQGGSKYIHVFDEGGQKFIPVYSSATP